MFNEPIFAGYPVSTKVFYRRLFYMLALNIVAVELKVYDVVLCDTVDPLEFDRFRVAMPEIQAKVQIIKSNRRN